MNIRRAIFNIIDLAAKIVLVVIAVMYIIRGIHYAYDLGLGIFDQKPFAPMDTRTVTMVVTGADSVSDIGKQLEEKGLIKDAGIFWIQERLSVNHDLIGAGSYELSPSMTPDEMIAIMAAPTIAARAEKDKEQIAEENIAAAASAEQEGSGGPDESDDAAGMGAQTEPEAETGGDAAPPAE